MLLVITRDTTPNTANKLAYLFQCLDARDIPYEIVGKCDPDINHKRRKDIRGLILPGARFRIHPDEPQPELNLELYYLFHFPTTPVLGICHGCQFLMTYYGGTLRSYDTLWTGARDVELNLSVSQLFKGQDRHETPQFYFHELPVAPQPPEPGTGIREIAWITKFRDGRRHACAFEFEKGRVYGVMFHPEAKKETHAILYNFYDNVASPSPSPS
jgi:GMP synthase-like glutamine amidotransferase